MVVVVVATVVRGYGVVVTVVVVDPRLLTSLAMQCAAASLAATAVFAPVARISASPFTAFRVPPAPGPLFASVQLSLVSKTLQGDSPQFNS